MPGARVIGMAMRDHRFVDRPSRVDVESAKLAAHAGGGRQQNVFGAHLRLDKHSGRRRDPSPCITAP